MRNINIKNSSSDAIDFDFCNVDLKEIKIFEPNGDGLDFSFSTGKINKAQIIKSADKGISIGENSIININDIYLENNKIGIAVKDGSFLNGELIRFKQNAYDVLSYNKKREFKNTSTILENIVSNKNPKIFNENNHIININDVYLENNNIEFDQFKE